MEKQGGVVSSMDASVQDVWDWEVLPDEHRSFYVETKPAAAASHGHGADDELLLGGKDPSIDWPTRAHTPSISDYDPLQSIPVTDCVCLYSSSSRSGNRGTDPGSWSRRRSCRRRVQGHRRRRGGGRDQISSPGAGRSQYGAGFDGQWSCYRAAGL